MGEIDTLVGLLKQVDELEHQVKQLKRHHLQFVTMLTFSFGGEMRVTPQDYANVPPGSTLSVAQDPATGDTLFKVEVPAHEPLS